MLCRRLSLAYERIAEYVLDVSPEVRRARPRTELPDIAPVVWWQRAARHGLTLGGPAAKIGARATKGAAVMSELDVIVIHIRAEQAAEYERLFAERELPRWREYKEQGAFISARIFRAAFGTDRRDDIVKYVIAVEVPSHAEHSQHDADPGFQEFNRLADAFQPEDPLVYGGQVLHAV
jgi:hypothetical protein